MRVTVVHERFTEFAGSERVVAELAGAWPDAPVYSPIARSSSLPPVLRGRVAGGSLSALVGAEGAYAHLLPLLPLAMRRLPIADTDVVIASHHAFATQVVHATTAPVVAYVHTPARWVWDPSMRAGEAGGRLGSAALAAFGRAFRPADRRAAAAVHPLVANSTAVAERIATWWGRSAVVVPPPVDVSFYTPDSRLSREDFFLLAGRLVPYKQPQLAVRAAAKAGKRLVVVGDGRSREECERLAGRQTTFVGRVDDETLRDLYRRCAALLMPGVEDFGIVPVEAQACGAPVLASGAGGSLDTVLPGRTGELVPLRQGSRDDGVAEWERALSSFAPERYDRVVVRRHAERFSAAAFRDAMRDVVACAVEPTSSSRSRT